MPHPRVRTAVVLVSLAAMSAVAPACGGPSTPSRSATSTDTDAAGTTTISGDITVFAAASLTEALTAVGDAFTVEHPDTTVEFSFAASSELATQIVEGAPADVFASADVETMARIAEADVAAGDPVVFARNRAEIVVAPDNPLGISGVDDLSDSDLILVTCAPQVPCGRYAAEVLARAGVEVTADSLEQNVKAVVTKVVLGEADAGIAYATDVIAAGETAAGVAIPDEFNVVAEYPIVSTRTGTNPSAAAAFVRFVLGPAGQEILTSYGFASP